MSKFKNIRIYLSTLAVSILIPFASNAQDQPGCDQNSVPYYAIGGHIKGEGVKLRNTFLEIRNSIKNITPENGFITMRLHVSIENEICKIEVFEIDMNYQRTSFNNGELIKQLSEVASQLSGWQRSQPYKSFNLIRFKIKDGEIEEIF